MTDPLEILDEIERQMQEFGNETTLEQKATRKSRQSLRTALEAQRDDEFERFLPVHAAGLSLEHNQHRNFYDTAERWVAENDWCDWDSDEAKQRAIDTDSIWTLQWYPNTPVGFFAVAAPTLPELLAMVQIEHKAREQSDE